MLEILFLVWFCKKLATIARDRNRAGGWGAVCAILWITGEVGGAIFGASSGAMGTGLYGYAILGALLGAVIAYIVVASVKPIPRDGDLPAARVV